MSEETTPCFQQQSDEEIGDYLMEVQLEELRLQELEGKGGEK